MNCSNCGAGIVEGAKFCSQCGFALTKRCPSCGAAYTSGSKFCAECGTRLGETSSPVAATTPRPVAASPVSAAERRHLTVMFCDLVGSTELSTRLELEDLQELIGAYQKTVTEVVTRFGDFVARRVGDGSLIYFGYPQVGEDDAEQAVRAGLDLIENLKVPERLRVRIGIATGLMVVEEAAQNQEVVGETPNLAARLHALAEPNTIVIADTTRRLLGSLFELEDLGMQACGSNQFSLFQGTRLGVAVIRFSFSCMVALLRVTDDGGPCPIGRNVGFFGRNRRLRLADPAPTG
jgi:class 3 adenylate cyclase